jgi:hypothetical protein
MEQPFPTVKPLNREQQKVAFDALKQSYSHEVPPNPVFPLAPVKEFKLTQEQQLKAAQEQFTERGLQQQVTKVEKQLEEKKTSTTINQFYCRHVYQAVNAKLMGIPVRYKVCQKCGLVK